MENTNFSFHVCYYSSLTKEYKINGENTKIFLEKGSRKNSKIINVKFFFSMLDFLSDSVNICMCAWGSSVKNLPSSCNFITLSQKNSKQLNPSGNLRFKVPFPQFYKLKLRWKFRLWEQNKI